MVFNCRWKWVDRKESERSVRADKVEQIVAKALASKRLTPEKRQYRFPAEVLACFAEEFGVDDRSAGCINEVHRQHNEKLKEDLAKQPKTTLKEVLEQSGPITLQSRRHGNSNNCVLGCRPKELCETGSGRRTVLRVLEMIRNEK
jgi:hypothetical protein